jgi:hypothetical protein
MATSLTNSERCRDRQAYRAYYLIAGSCEQTKVNWGEHRNKGSWQQTTSNIPPAERWEDTTTPNIPIRLLEVDKNSRRFWSRGNEFWTRCSRFTRYSKANLWRWNPQCAFVRHFRISRTQTRRRLNTERRGWVVNTPALYSGGTGFKSGALLSRLRDFVVFLSTSMRMPG